MVNIPKTSTTLLKDLARDSQHARWAEFVARYRPMMEAYMRERFPSVDADDVIQETLIALISIFPVYRYNPEEKGEFHNYLTGVLRHKALKILNKDRRHSEVVTEYGKDFKDALKVSSDSEEEAWRESLFEIALQQFIADETVQARTKEVFLRVAVNGEKAEKVAEDFGITRNAVDQIKARSMARIRDMVNALEKVNESSL